jgi:hypothetical protein
MFSASGEQQERVAHSIHLSNILNVRSSIDQRLDPQTARLRQWKSRTNRRVLEIAQNQISRENEFMAERVRHTRAAVDNRPHWSFGYDCKTTKISRELRLRAVTTDNLFLLNKIETVKPCVDFKVLDQAEKERQQELDRKLMHARNYRRQMNLRVKPDQKALVRPATSPVDQLMKLITK